MRWLDSPENEAERALREGLDQAARRTGDEITHRRVWSKIATAVDLPRPRFLGRFALAGSALVLLFSAGAVVYSYLPLHSQTSTAAQVAGAGKAPAVEALVAEAPRKSVTEVPLSEAERAPWNVVRTRAGERARVGLGGGAVAEMDENSAITWDNQHRPAIERGTARLSVPHQPPGWRFSVTAGPYLVTVVGTKFDVRIADHTVGVEVNEGVVEVWRGSQSTRLVAGDSWSGPLFPEEVQPRLAPAPAGLGQKAERAQVVPEKPAAGPEVYVSRPVQEARAALRLGESERAVVILTRAAHGTGPAAENAAYELGRVMRYNLKRPRMAVALWDKYRTRFPSGLLRAEADLSIVETLSQLGDVRAALAEADAFVARYPQSERRFEVERLAARLRAAEPTTDPK